jgi:hypothetical protein
MQRSCRNIHARGRLLNFPPEGIRGTGESRVRIYLAQEFVRLASAAILGTFLMEQTTELVGPVGRGIGRKRTILVTN